MACFSYLIPLLLGSQPQTFIFRYNNSTTNKYKQFMNQSKPPNKRKDSFIYAVQEVCGMIGNEKKRFADNIEGVD